jgi:uncharacterized protein
MFSLYTMAVDTFAPVLGTLSKLLDAASRHAREQGRNPDELVEARLAPDMLALAQQVQLACDHGRGGTMRLVGREAPKLAHSERTIAELQGRIAQSVTDIRSVAAADFDGTAERRIVLPLSGKMVLDQSGFEHLRDWLLPNFYFHIVTAYDILRHEGVPIGKRDYLQHIGGSIRSA